MLLKNQLYCAAYKIFITLFFGEKNQFDLLASQPNPPHSSSNSCPVKKIQNFYFVVGDRERIRDLEIF